MRDGESARPRLGVSSCLLGAEVRFNGGHKRFRFLTDELAPFVDWVPYCPEIEIGLGTPREAIRLTAAGRLVNRGGTADHTDAMDGAAAACGLGRVRVQGQVAELRDWRHSAVPAGRAAGRSRGARAVRRAGAGCFPAAGGGGRGAAERRGAAGGVRRARVRRGPAAVACLVRVVGAAGSGRLPRAAQAAAAGARPGALRRGGPGRGHGRVVAAGRGCVPGGFPGGHGGAGHPGASRQRAAARVQPGRPGAGPGPAR